jgi:hypothetical protein
MIQVVLDNKVFTEAIMPTYVTIKTSAKGSLKLICTMLTITFNEELSFPYSVQMGIIEL